MSQKCYCEIVTKIPIWNNFLAPISEMSEGISRAKNIVIESLETKQSIKMFKCFVNEEMK